MQQSSVFIAPQKTLIQVAVTVDKNGYLPTTAFGLQLDLVDRKIISIESYCYNDVQITGNPPIAGTTSVIDETIMNNCFVTLNREPGVFAGGFWYKSVPLRNFRRQWNIEPTINSAIQAQPDRFQMDPEIISWEDSYLTFPSRQAILIPGASYLVLFLISWLFPDQDDRMYRAVKRI